MRLRQQQAIWPGYLFLLLIGCWPLGGEAQTISNHAGNGTEAFAGDGGDADDASLSSPLGIHGDTTGVVYFADSGNHAIRRVTALTDSITTVAGSGGVSGYTGDGAAATSATLNTPADVFASGSGVLYIADTGNHVIRQVSAAGVITTIAGTGSAGFSGDNGVATSAQLSSPSGIFVTLGDTIYIADSGNNRIRRIIAGTITTIAGNDTAGFTGDGAPADSAQLNAPSDVVLDSDGTVYIADTNNHRIRTISRVDSTITTLAGSSTGGFSGDGDIPSNAQLAFPEAVFVDSSGNVLVADRFNQRIRRINANGNITTLVGDGTLAHSGDEGAANRAQIASPSGVFMNPSGAILIADTGNHRIRRVDVDNVAGLAGADTTAPGREVQILDVSLTGDGQTSVKALTLTVSDLSSASGIENADFEEFRLYESEDAVLDVGDLQVGSIDSASVTLGQAFAIQANQVLTPGPGAVRHYIVSALIAATASENTSFKVGFATGDLATTSGGWVSRLTAQDSDRMTIDIVATRLVFTTQPAGSISGTPLLVQPVITAFNDSGLVDTDFSDVVTLTEAGAGALLNGTATASSGVATFNNVIYNAAIDDEEFTLTADDAVGVSEGDLPAVVAANSINSNLVNDPPVVSFQPFVLDEDDSLSFPVSAFISDVDDSILTIEFSSSHINATISDDVITLSPEANFFGLDTLSILVTDPFGAQGSAAAEIQIEAENDSPTLTPLDSLIFDEDDTLQIDLSAQVEDVDDPFEDLSWVLTPSAGLGHLYDAGSGLLDLWTSPDSSGIFSLALSVRDAGFVSARDTVAIHIRAISDPPALDVPDTSMAQDTALSLDLRPFASDIDDEISDLEWAATGSPGISVSVDASGLASIQLDSAFAGSDTILFTVSDASGISTSDSVVIQVFAVPTPPEPPAPPMPPTLSPIPDSSAIAGETLVIDLTPFASDPDDSVDVLIFSVSGAVFSSVGLSAGVLTVVTTAGEAFVENLSVTVTDSDGQSASASFTFSVELPLGILAAFPDSLIFEPRITRELLLDAYLIPERDPATVVWAALPSDNLHVVIDPETRLVSVESIDNWKGVGRIVFTGSDSSGASESDTVAIEVVNPPPVIDLPDLFLDAGESAPLPLDEFAVDDEDVGLLSWTATPDPGIQVIIDNALRFMTFTASTEFSGEAVVLVRAEDVQGALASDSVTVTVRALVDSADTSVDTTVTPADSTVTPADSTVTPADSTVTPADSTVAPADTTVTPADTTVAPADTTVAPADTTVTPADTADTSATGGIPQLPPDTTANSAPNVAAFAPISFHRGGSAQVALDLHVADDAPVGFLEWTAVPDSGLVVSINMFTRIATISSFPDFVGDGQVRFTASDSQDAVGSGAVAVAVLPPPPDPDPGDFDANGVIDLVDFFFFADNFGLAIVHANWNPVYDLDGNGRVSFEDFFVFSDLFGAFQSQ